MACGQGNLAEALQSYGDGLAIREHLANSDPGNAGWQRDLATVHSKVGVALQKMGQTAAAREEFVAGRTIMATLIERNPGELHLSQQELGDIAGGTRESVNKIERNWHKAGWSERIKGTIVIRDLAEIRRLADMPDL
jgi:DNA-binding XRE family transcriptional regulator